MIPNFKHDLNANKKKFELNKMKSYRSEGNLNLDQVSIYISQKDQRTFFIYTNYSYNLGFLISSNLASSEPTGFIIR